MASTAGPTPASGFRPPSAGQNRWPPSVGASGEWRCRWRRSFQRQAAAAARPSSKAGLSRQRQHQNRREDPPRNRRERIFRRRPRHRSPVPGEGRPVRSPARNRSGRVTHHSTFPAVRAAIPAANSAAAAPSTAPFPPPATSCRPPKANPPPGRTLSIAATPNGKTVRARAFEPSRRAMRSRSSEMAVGGADTLICPLKRGKPVICSTFVLVLAKSQSG